VSRRTYTRREKATQKYTNKDIIDYISTTPYVLIDILEGSRVIIKCTEGYTYTIAFKSILDGRTPRFKPTESNVKRVCKLNGVHFVKSLEGLGTNAYRITYTYGGISYNKKFYHLKELGHLPDRRLRLEDITPRDGLLYLDIYRKYSITRVKGVCETHGLFDSPYSTTAYLCPECAIKNRAKHIRKFTTEDVMQHAILYDINITKTDGHKVTYVCCNNHEPVTVKYSTFTRKTSNKCNVCTQSAGMQYHNGTIHNYEDVPAIIYVLVLTKGNETFRKVGITKHDVKRRTQRIKGYDLVSSTAYNMTLPEAYALEQKTLKAYKEYKYNPLVDFVGRTECVLASEAELNWYIKNEIKNEIKNNIKTNKDEDVKL